MTFDDDDDLGASRREALIGRDRAYPEGRFGARRRFRRRRAERIEGESERDVLWTAGFGLGGGGAALVVVGIVLMAIAYFGLGFGGYESLGGYDGGGGYSPEVGPYGGGEGYGGGDDLLSQRLLTFMGGGFLFLAGWILVVASRLRSFLTDEL
jgi:hypothetical protein